MTKQRTAKAPERIRLGSSSGPLTGEAAEDTNSTVFRLFAYLKAYRWRLMAVAGLVIVGTLMGLAGPILLGLAIDDYIIPGDGAGYPQGHCCSDSDNGSKLQPDLGIQFVKTRAEMAI